MKKLYIIDTLGPFFLNNHQEATINWSKVHFTKLESEKRLPASTKKRIERRFLKYINQVEALGYNSLSIDDLAHLAILQWYNPDLQQLLQDYRALYQRLFQIARQQGMKIFINTDYLFFNQDIETHLQQTNTSPGRFFKRVIEQVFYDFPEIEGIILRLGENDGKDVRGRFLSRLMIQTPAQLNTLLKEILPLFETHHKLLIVRTWTVGTYQIGDLIWNQKTYNTAFDSIQSSALIISMKFGDTDFMRYLTLNPLLLTDKHQKLIELQTRREWEGMGLFPSFVGWDYAGYLQQLQRSELLVGIHVWCQTGGWAKKAWTNVTYLDNSSFWNELNTEVTIAIVRQKISVEKAIAIFCKKRGITEVNQFIKLLELSEVAITKGFYLPDLAEKTLYFRRTRIPPLAWLTWDRVRVSPVAAAMYRAIVSSENSVVSDADHALVAAKRMVTITKNINLSSKVIDSLQFEYATLELFQQIRRYIFDGLAADTVQKSIDTYQQKYPQHYVTPQLSDKTYWLPKWIIKRIIRERPAYRRFDKLLLKTSPLQLRLARFALRRTKSRLMSQAMGIDTIFK